MPVNAVKAWSYSRIALYEQCPLRFKLKHIDKLPEPQSDAMARGDRIHKTLATCLTNKSFPLPPETKKFEWLLKELRKAPDVIVEQQWGFTKQWKPTGWFGKDTWFRAVLDVAVMYDDLTAEVGDWKTGKKYGSNNDQMELFGLSLLCQYKPVTYVTTRLVYLDSGDQEFAEFTRGEVPQLKAKWEAKVKPMFEDTVFAARPNDKCRWCHYRRDNGGPCRFG